MDIREKFFLDRASGPIGVEVEVEGDDLPRRVDGWDTEHDGSLVGESREYVLSQPLTLVKAGEALDSLDQAYKNHGSVLCDSCRTSVHIHINVQTLTPTQLFNFMTAYLVLEEMLVKFCGESRVGNLFCLRVRDAEHSLDQYVLAAKTRELHPLGDENIRYSAMNTNSVAKFGSLEFRAMRGGAGTRTIKIWMGLLFTLRNKSKEFANPQEIIKHVSSVGTRQFIRDLLGTRSIHLAMDSPNLDQMLFDGMRNAQDLAYARENWENF